MSVPGAVMAANMAPQMAGAMRPPGPMPAPNMAPGMAGGMKPSPGIAGGSPAPGPYPGMQRPSVAPNIPANRPIMPVGGGGAMAGAAAPQAQNMAPQMRLANALRGGFR
jgi:hypothetical protein